MNSNYVSMCLHCDLWILLVRFLTLIRVRPGGSVGRNVRLPVGIARFTACIHTSSEQTRRFAMRRDQSQSMCTTVARTGFQRVPPGGLSMRRSGTYPRSWPRE